MSFISNHRNGHNAVEEANRIALLNTPLADLPKYQRKDAEEAAELRAKAEEAEARMNRNEEAKKAYLTKAEYLQLKQQELENGKIKLSLAHADVKGFAKDFAAWPQNPWPMVCDRVNSLLIARELIAVLPGWITQAEAEIRQLEAEVSAMAKKYSE